MYQPNEIEMWRQHRDELVREAEDQRLARQLRAARPSKVARIRSALLGRGRVPVDAAGGLRAGDSRCA
jgi:hypothetical protein